MATKLYLHRGTTSDTGTLPAAAASASEHAPSFVGVGGDTNRSMDTTISAVAQTSLAVTTQATTAIQDTLLGRWCSGPLIAQTIASQLLTVSFAASESNASSDFFPCYVVVLWRPGTGATVADISPPTFNAGANPFALEAGTSQTSFSNNFTTTSRDALDGDIIVLEIWRNTGIQGMGTAYTNTIFYDGTTEASLTNIASFINFPNTITFQDVAVSFQPRPSGTLFQDPAVFMGGIKRAWHRRRSGIFVPEYAI